ncbi:hypothetical protein Tco_1452928, partial [Tanacetum coccineum]
MDENQLDEDMEVVKHIDLNKEDVMEKWKWFAQVLISADSIIGF